MAFDDEAFLQQDFTGSMGDLVDALDALDPRLETAMYDAIYLSVDHVKKGKLNKKALLVISDGEDTASKWGFNKVLQHVQESKDVTIYAVGILDENDSRSGGLFKKSPQKKAREALKEIAEASGGQAFFPKSIDRGRGNLPADRARPAQSVHDRIHLEERQAGWELAEDYGQTCKSPETGRQG